ncbi:MAG: dihydrofolate reductase family protein [Homoserinimonas sp.]
MATVQYYVASTIDGFIADDNDNLDWLLQFGFENFQDDYNRFMADVGAIVMGSTTYEWIIAEGEPWAYGTTPAWVLTSRGLPEVTGADIRFFQGDVTELHRQALAAAEGKNVWVVGGGNVAAQFADRGLLDELLLTVMPIILGSGKSLLPIGTVTEPLTLVSSTPYPLGAIGLHYRLTGLVDEATPPDTLTP